MSEIAFNAHSGVRYLVLLVGVIALLYANFGLARKKPVDKTGLTLLRIFVGVLDLQFLLGVITVLTRPFFSALVNFMISGPVMIQVLEGEGAVAKNRELMGATNPKEAAPGTIRADFADSIDANAVHGSDSLENAAIEIAYFFPATDVYSR